MLWMKVASALEGLKGVFWGELSVHQSGWMCSVQVCLVFIIVYRSFQTLFLICLFLRYSQTIAMPLKVMYDSGSLSSFLLEWLIGSNNARNKE